MMRRGPGLVRTVGRTAVIAGTATAVSGRVAHRQNERYDAEYAQQQYAQQQAAQPQAPPSYAAPAASADELPYEAQLEKLSQLKARGIITDEEFQAKKKQLLGI